MSEKTPIVPNKRLQQTQAQVDHVIDIMRVNVDKVLERDKNLSELDGRAEALQAGASQFEASAGKLKKKFWWKNCKMIMCIAVLLVTLIVLTIVWIVTNQKAKDASGSTSEPLTLNSTLQESIHSPGLPGGLRGRETVPNWSDSSNIIPTPASPLSASPITSVTSLATKEPLGLLRTRSPVINEHKDKENDVSFVDVPTISDV